MIAAPATAAPLAPIVSGNWSGSYALPASAASAASVPITLTLHDRRVTVSLGPGHTGATEVPLIREGAHVRFRLAGLPRNLVFDGAPLAGRLSGTVRQGMLEGTFALRRGTSRIVSLLGAYRSGRGAAVAVLQPAGVPPILVQFPSGATHGISPSLTVGKRLGDSKGYGAITVDASGFMWRGTHYARVHLRQREVRVGVNAATLTLPQGHGPFPAAVMVHGSGASDRSEFDVFSVFLALHGVAVLADDKRGVGESRGTYPGDQASNATINVLSHDAAAEVRYLATLSQIDSSRIGLFGDSQAGWIIPLTAARAPVHWMLLNSGPTTTVGETDYWGALAGQSQTPPSGTRAAMLAKVRQVGRTGFDPLPYLRRLHIPGLWMFGSDDRNIPTELCVDRLKSLKRDHDYSSIVLPTAHTPLILPTGLLASLPSSPGFDHRFFLAIQAWLRARRLG